MGYSPQEFDAAFAKVSGKYTFASRSIAEQVLGHLETFIRQNDRVTLATKKTFRQLIQDSLIEANVKGEVNLPQQELGVSPP